MAENEFGLGVVQIDPPRPEEDAASGYMEVVQAQGAAVEDRQWAELLGKGAAADPAPIAAPDKTPQEEGAKPAAAPGAPEDEGGGFLGAVGDVASDIGRGVVEAPGQVVGGIADAFGEAGQLLGEITGIGGVQFFDENEDGTLGDFNPKYLNFEEFQDAGGDSLVNAISTEDADSTTGGFVRATSQFLVGFIPALKGAKAVGLTGKIAAPMAAGAVADMVVFDPHEDRLSTFLNEVPVLEPYVSDYLADNNPETESSWEGRIKNAIEGAGLGLTTEAAGALFRAFKYYKVQRAQGANFAPEQPSVQAQAGRDALKEAARQELVQDVPDAALSGLGTPDGPRLMRFDEMKEGETTIQAYLRGVDAEERAAASLKRNDALARISAAAEGAMARMGVDTPEDGLDAMLNAVRAGTVPSGGAAKPVATILKSLGGIDPTSGVAAELRNLGVTSRTHPGLFKKGGITSLDNVPVAEQPIFQAKNLDDGNGYVPEQAFLDAMQDELAGNPWRTLDEQTRYADDIQPIEDLMEELRALGLNPEEMSNANIRKRLDEIIEEEEALAREFAPEGARPADLEDILDDAYDRETAELQAEGDAGQPKPEPKVFINHSRINSPDDVKAVLQEMADMDADAIKEKTRGTVTNEQTLKESSQEYRDLDDLIGRPPGPMSAAQAVAARKLLTSSGEQIVELAKRASAADASPADLFNFRRAMSVHYAIQSEVIAARTETARALQSWSIPAGATKARSQAITDLIMQNGGSGDLQALAKAVSTTGENPAALNAMTRELGRGKFGRAMYQVWINGLLSSPKTHVVNMLSNAMVAAYSIPERYLASGISKAFYDGEVAPGEASAQVFGMVKGMRDGLRLIWHGNNAAGMEGIGDVFDAFGKSEIHVSDISAEAFGLGSEGAFGRGLDMLGKIVNVPGSLLGGEDKFFKSIGYRMELNALAYRTAASEGLEGEGAAKRVADILANPPDRLQADALDAAHYMTFTNELGKTGRKFQSTVQAIPAARLVLPFIRTPTNIVKYTFARTPLAYMSGAIRADIAAGGARAAQAHARVALGSIVMLSVSDMALEGSITGRGPSDNRLRAAQMNTGWMPYSVKVGDRWYQYSRTDPIGMMMGIGADIAELTSNANAEDSEMMATAAVLALANNLANKTYMTGIYDFIGAIDPSNPTNTPGKYIADFAGSMTPYSSFLRGVASSTDTVIRETRGSQYGDDGKVDPVGTYFDNLIAGVRKSIPGMGEDLPPRRDLFGEPIDRASGLGWGYDFLSPIASRADNPDPVTQVILDNQIRISNVPRTIQGVALSGEQYSEFSRLAGQPLKEHLDKLVASSGFKRLSDGPDGMKAEVVRDAVNTFRDRAKAIMMRENPDLQRLSYMRQLERANILKGDN